MNFCAGLAVLSFLLASCLVTESEGLQCYQCTLCNDPFDSSAAEKVNCGGSCYKGKASDSVTRQCLETKIDDVCKEETEHGTSVEGCACNSDLCNSSSIPKFSISVAMMMFALKYML